MTVLAFAAMASAQETAKTAETTSEVTEIDGTVMVNEFSKNWEIAFGVGTQAFIGEYSTTDLKFGDWWALPAFYFSIQKWASPFLGIGLGFNVAPFKGLYGTGDTSATWAASGDDIYSGNLKMQNGWYGNAFVKGLVDFTNLFAGYKSDRNYHLTGYIGGGLVFPFGATSYKSTNASVNLGLINQFKLSQNWLLNLAIRGAFYGDDINGISYFTSGDKNNVPLDAMAGITLGVSYKFGFVEKTNPVSGEKVITEWLPLTAAIITSKEYAAALEETMKALEDGKNTEKALADANKALLDKDAELAAAKAEAEANANKVVEKMIDYRQIVNFPIDKCTVSNREKVSIMLAAEVMKAAPDTKFLVTGYADKQTATPKRNKELSEGRAAAVKKILVNEFGIPEDQLVIDDMGGVDYMYYNDPQCSRTVVIESIVIESIND